MCMTDFRSLGETANILRTKELALRLSSADQKKIVKGHSMAGTFCFDGQARTVILVWRREGRSKVKMHDALRQIDSLLLDASRRCSRHSTMRAAHRHGEEGPIQERLSKLSVSVPDA